MVPGFETWGVVMGVFGLLLLAFVRLCSERSIRIGSLTALWSRKEQHMSERDSLSEADNEKGKSRSFGQYLCETVWAYGAGVMAAHWLP